ncbi:unnamed protein product [Paramecium sonneborni]|uniref:Uncharacterized protein n=1 Tax=Paramecium sonneborni TaxID=65129 RepID=A0A8S1Q6P7_9CILI|nr:unnamed protein product [Paramecium sonneborni]
MVYHIRTIYFKTVQNNRILSITLGLFQFYIETNMFIHLVRKSCYFKIHLRIILLSNFYPLKNSKLKAQINSYLDFHLNEMIEITEYELILQNNYNYQIKKNKQIQINCYNFVLKFFSMKENINTSIIKKLSQQLIQSTFYQLFYCCHQILLLVVANYEFNSEQRKQKLFFKFTSDLKIFNRHS